MTTTIAIRPEPGTAHVQYERELPAGALAIGAVAAAMVAWSVLPFAALSVRVGLLGLAVGAVVVFLDARYATATSLAVRDRNIELGYRGRVRQFRAGEIVARHDVRRGRLVLARARRAGKGRVLARLGRRHADDTVAAFMRAGIEVQSH
jgi:hypothetical protein